MTIDPNFLADKALAQRVHEAASALNAAMLAAQEAGLNVCPDIVDATRVCDPAVRNVVTVSVSRGL